MSSFIQKLPTELLLLIFDHVDSVSQMAECGLVCQEWNRIAQPLMLSKTLYIESEEEAYQLYYYLLNHPYYATRIKDMDIHLQHSSEDEGFNKLISVAFTPSMERLTGVVNSKRFFKTLIKTADKYDAADSFSRLKSIPSAFYDNKFYDTALTRFRDTLESMHLTSTNASQRTTAANRLSNFKNLNKIHIDFHDVNAVNQLDTILKDCTRVEELGIHMYYRNQIILGGRLLPWNRETVQQNPTMKTLCIYGKCNLQLLKFLLYKYPHVNRVVIDTIYYYRWDDFDCRIFMPARDVYRIVDIMHDTSSSYSINFRLQKGSTVEAIKNYILRHNGKILVSNSFFQIVEDSMEICTDRSIHYIEATHNLN